jgi:hypothetical protein
MPAIYRPQSGENAFLYAWTVGFRWRTGWRRAAAAQETGEDREPESRK